MIFKLRPIAVTLISVLSLQGCAHLETAKQKAKETFASDDPCSNNARNIGILLGTVAGAVIGNKVADNKTAGTLIGLGLGGALGAFIGAEIDKRECELSKIGQKYNLDMQVTPLAVSSASVDQSNNNSPKSSVQNVGLSVSVTDIEGKSQFNPGSGELLSDAKIHFSEIAKQYSPSEQAKLLSKDKTEKEQKAVFNELSTKRILLIGHTDDTGNTKVNAELSEKRAKSVAKLFKDNGVNENQLFYQGSGETMPIADNNTPEGRAKNRRVEIVDLSSDESFKLYLQNKRAKTEYYRAVDIIDAKKSANTTQAEIKTKTQTKTTNKVLHDEVPSNTKEKVIDTSKKLDQKSIVAKVKESPRSWIDFGGSPVTRENSAVNLGEVATAKPKFSLISTAEASDMKQISVCSMDRPREAGAVKSLASGREYATNAHLPSLNGRSWQDTVGGNLVVLNRVAVLRDGAALANPPELKVYANYNPSKNRNPKPDLSVEPAVNVYQGSNGLLYRIFVQGNHSLQCMDVLMPLDNSGVAKSGKVIYGNKGNALVADFKPSMIR